MMFVTGERAVPRIRVLLAEDHVVVREGTRELLERQGDIEVVGQAGDGQEAVKLAADLRPDVVVMDIAMPRVNGIEATKQIKARFPNTAVLILSAYDNDQYVFAVLQAGAAGYLLKNVRSCELIEAVRTVRFGESVLHPVVARKVMGRLWALRARRGDERPALPVSDRELEVLQLAARGMANKDIARELCISVRTVHAHFWHIFNKLGVGSRTEAVLRGLEAGWLDLPREPEQLSA